MQQPTLKRYLACVGSLKVTFAGICMLVTGVLSAYLLDRYLPSDSSRSWWLVVPLALLAANLGCALLVDPRLNQRVGLLTFHVALLALILLAILNELTGFHGRVELVTGQSFESNSVFKVEAGPLHALNKLQAVRFVQGDLQVDYLPGVIRQATTSRIFREDTGTWERIGDSQPFRSEGYVFHTTSNKGFAALVSWIPAGGSPVMGAVHFPSYPIHEWRQVADWQPQGGDRMTLTLQGMKRVEEAARFSLDESSAWGIMLGVAGQRLAPGEMISLPGGMLRFESVRLWMGYEIRSQPLTLWMLLAAMMGMCGISLHIFGPRATSGVATPRSGPVGLAARHA